MGAAARERARDFTWQRLANAVGCFGFGMNDAFTIASIALGPTTTPASKPLGLIDLGGNLAPAAGVSVAVSG